MIPYLNNSMVKAKHDLIGKSSAKNCGFLVDWEKQFSCHLFED